MAKIKGNRSGMNLKNRVGNKVEALMTVAKLKSVYLFGVVIQDRNTGELLSDATYQQAIDTAVSYMEHFLDISITPVIDEQQFYDYHLNSYAEWGYMQLDNYPVESVTAIDMVYFNDDDGTPTTVQTIPQSWIRLNAHDGTIRLIPNTRFPAQLQISETGSFFPEILRADMIPHAWRVTYSYGFCSGNVPILLNEAIGILATSILLVTAGHLILGAGIAGTSISMDGLSQSLQTTQSAENSGFSATIKDYSNRLFGTVKDDPFAILNILKEFYKGESFTIL